MKRFIALLMVALMLVTFGCSKDERTIDDVVWDANFETLVEYVEANGGFTFQVAAPPTSVDGVAAFVADYELIVDVRTTYAAGHIEGAVNWAAADFKTNLAAENPTGKVLVVCYSGQTASHLQIIGKMMGYNTYTLKWGMSGWNSSLDSWSANVATATPDYWSTEEEEDADWYDTPVISETGTGSAILDARLDVVVAGGLQGVTASAALADEYVINYWSEDHYNTYGHVENAYRITPGSMTTTTNLFNIPSTELVNVYCYTGQTSAALSTYLNTLGYTVKSAKYGVNGMIGVNNPVPWHTPSVDLPLVQ